MKPRFVVKEDYGRGAELLSMTLTPKRSACIPSVGGQVFQVILRAICFVFSGSQVSASMIIKDTSVVFILGRQLLRSNLYTKYLKIIASGFMQLGINSRLVVMVTFREFNGLQHSEDSVRVLWKLVISS